MCLLGETCFVVMALETVSALLLSGKVDSFTAMSALTEALDTQDLGVINRLLKLQAGPCRAATALTKRGYVTRTAGVVRDRPRMTDKGGFRRTEQH